MKCWTFRQLEATRINLAMEWNIMDKVQPTTPLSQKIPSLHNIKPRTEAERDAQSEKTRARVEAAQRAKAESRSRTPQQ